MVRIFIDSAADFEPDEIKRMHITCIPISVYFGDKEYLENVNLTKNEFYELLRSEKKFPNTSQPSLHAFESALEEAKSNGDEAVIITISSALSGTYQGAMSAKNSLGYDDCYVIDSRTASGGERILAQQAVKMRDAGKNADEIFAFLCELRSKIVLYACMDTLEYLHVGGRISHSAYAIGSVAHIKPIISVSKEGCAEITAKTLGMKRGMEYLCKMIKKAPLDCDFPVYIMYTDNRKIGEALAQFFEKNGITVSDNQIINVGAVIGSHIGPDSCGIVYVKVQKATPHN